MTDEERDLLLIDLSARVPFNVLIENGENYPYTLLSVSNGDLDWCTWDESGDHDLFSTKPYLFPFSCMTEEIEIGEEKFIPLVKYAEIRHFNMYHTMPVSIKISDGAVTTYCEDRRMNIKTRAWETLHKTQNVDFFHRYHIDWRGLCDRDLAIDARIKNVYKKIKADGKEL